MQLSCSFPVAPLPASCFVSPDRGDAAPRRLSLASSALRPCLIPRQEGERQWSGRPAFAVAPEDAGEVARQAARYGDHDVEALVEIRRGGMSRHPLVGGAGDAPAGRPGYRVEACGFVRPLFHLDEDDGAA